MTLIEQAALRLKQLERAGVTIPADAPRRAAGADAPAPRAKARAQPPSIAPFPAPAPATIGQPMADRLSPSALRVEAPRRRNAIHPPIVLDLERLRAGGHLVPDQVRSEMAEQFRHVKRPLLKTARTLNATAGQRGGLIMVTSALPGEGKTFCSINLAMSMAMEVDTSVILIDADVVRPSMSARLGVTVKHPGLLDHLAGDGSNLSDLIIDTNVPKLRLMAAGGRSERSTELLASAAMDRLLTELSEEYADHVVIFDGPPLLLTTESVVLASKVGQVVVVVECAKTPTTAVQQAFAALKACPNVVSVLNKCEQDTDGRRYGYYYG
jgi:protein-tyrosine kinase